MYAIVNIAGQQFKVQQGEYVYVHRLAGAEGDAVAFNEVLLLDNNGSVSVGTPVVAGAVVNGTILSHVRGDKVIIFKKKRRKGYQKQNGHRQDFTKVKIDTIVA